ncbi:Uncharacterized protein FKW44_012127, partial [Caligus rogercresseyi]
IQCTLQNIKSFLALKITTNAYVVEEDLRPIMIGASARYAALSIKIPDVGAPTWKWAGDIIKYVPERSKLYISTIKRILRRHRAFLNQTNK